MPTPSSISAGWFQTKQGNVHSGGEIKANVPAGKDFSLDGEGGFPGVISYQGSFEPDFSPDRISSKKWLVKSKAERNSYVFFYRFLGSPTGDNFDGYQGEIVSNGVYYSADEVELEDKVWNFPAGTKAVVLIARSLKIKNKIIVPQGSFLAFVVKGDIEIAGAVERLEGVYIADEEIKILASDKRFVGEGIFMAKRFSLNRDLKNLNSRFPAEQFLFRPDFLINAYSSLWWAQHFWEELGP